ncbi:hypothetical protein TU79_01175 [Pseudomonas trivialis]|uniref:Uncharacterized protein n=1 Tax=Pseudomonas trivialis TaxID=200450 RepID=A0A0R3A0S4_9PSED|nr:hypothetical protein TU79_01175 [Pseudomonas trivialis]
MPQFRRFMTRHGAPYFQVISQPFGFFKFCQLPRPKFTWITLKLENSPPSRERLPNKASHRFEYNLPTYSQGDLFAINYDLFLILNIHYDVRANGAK